MKEVIIFDLDGTIALIDHRKHFIECPSSEQDWSSFYEACDEDELNQPIAAIIEQLSFDYYILIMSGRSAQVRNKTVEWLLKNGISYDKLIMRPEVDFTPDEILKKKWAEEVGLEKIAMVFDDRDKVVKMWRSLGLTCLQVAEGSF